VCFRGELGVLLMTPYGGMRAASSASSANPASLSPKSGVVQPDSVMHRASLASKEMELEQTGTYLKIFATEIFY